VTGIQTLNALLNGNSRIYDVNGSQRSRLGKGINIIDNKKVYLK
jgi:hypothetical protein